MGSNNGENKMTSYEELEKKWKKVRAELHDMQVAKTDGSCKEYEDAKKTHTKGLSQNES